MYGAILGDIIGSPYEFDQGNKTKDFPLFSQLSAYTDDTCLQTTRRTNKKTQRGSRKAAP